MDRKPLNIDLLGGLGSVDEPIKTSMPNLVTVPQLSETIGMQQQSLIGGPTSLIGTVGSPNPAMPPLQPTSNLNVFQHPHPNVSALIDSPVLAPNQTSAVNTKPGADNVEQQQEKKITNLPSTWNNVGSLNMDLANFSLSNPTQKKAAMSMNAMKMSQSSSKSPSPLSPMGKGGFPPAAPSPQPQSGSFDLL